MDKWNDFTHEQSGQQQVRSLLSPMGVGRSSFHSINGEECKGTGTNVNSALGRIFLVGRKYSTFLLNTGNGLKHEV